MLDVIQQLINGLLIGGAYALVGGGFSLVYGVMSIINLAHGSLVMLGAYVTYYLFANANIDPIVTIPFSMLIIGVIAYYFQLAIGNRVLKHQLTMSVVITFGLDLVLINVAMLLFSANYRSVTPAYVYSSISIGGIVIPLVRLLTFFAAAAVAGLLYFVLYRTNIGMAIRATALNNEAARLVGIKPERIYAFTFALGAALAATAGSLLSMVSVVTPFMGVPFLGKAFAVAVLGGLGNVNGAVYAGLILGVAEGLTALTLGPEYQKAVAFLVLIGMLMLRPQGLMGRRFFA